MGKRSSELAEGLDLFLLAAGGVDDDQRQGGGRKIGIQLKDLLQHPAVFKGVRDGEFLAGQPALESHTIPANVRDEREGHEMRDPVRSGLLEQGAVVERVGKISLPIKVEIGADVGVAVNQGDIHISLFKI